MSCKDMALACHGSEGGCVWEGAGMEDMPAPFCRSSEESAPLHLSAGIRQHRMTVLPAGQASGNVLAQRPCCHYRLE